MLRVTIFVMALTFSISSIAADGTEAYLALSGSAKLEYLWKQITKTPYSLSNLPTKGPGNLAMLLSCARLLETFTYKSDFLPLDRGGEKAIHTYGSVAAGTFIPQASQYTGLFETGSPIMIRISLAAQGGGYTPGFGMKFFVDGRETTNIVAMPSLDGQGDNKNPFAKNYNTALPEPKSLPLKFGALIFRKAIQPLGWRVINERTISLHTMSSLKANGDLVKNPTVPYQLSFVPLLSMPSNDARDLRVKLDEIAPLTPLFSVVAKASADDPGVIVGTIVSQSKFVATKEGDQQLFFRHPFIEDLLPVIEKP